MRTNHKKEKYLETGKYPKAKLTIVSLKLPAALLTAGEAEAPFTGTLSLHGVDKPVAGTSSLKRVGDRIDVDAKFDATIGDYGIAVPKFAGITVAQDVKVEVKFQGIVTR
jgi:polyisoprenoid-binding protein YceI